MAGEKKISALLISLFLFIFPLFGASDLFFLQSNELFMGESEFASRIDPDVPGDEPFGLVLCGGSVRAYAHIGVLKEMEKADIKPDFIVASSIGGIIGTMYACGFSPDDIEKIVTTLDFTTFFDKAHTDSTGSLSFQYFNQFISILFPGKTFDIKNAAIPIIIPTTDPISGRQVLYAQGEIKDVMAANFKMSYLMEPVNVSLLDDSTIMRMEDSGDIDLYTLSIAERFSRNLLVSSALYSPPPQNENVAVISNSFRPGKEQTLISKLMANRYAWIRNDLSDMAFSESYNTKDIILRGQKTAEVYFKFHTNIQAKKLSDTLKENTEFTRTREIRHQFAENAVKEIQKDKKRFKRESKSFAMEAQNSSGVELKDFLFSEKLTSGLYTFFDFRPLYVLTGIKANFFTFWGPGEDYLPEIQTKLNSELQSFSSIDSVFKKIEKQQIVLGLEFKKNFYIPGIINIRPYVTAELSINFLNNLFDKTIYLARTGAEFFNSNPTVFSFVLNPYGYFYTNNIPCNDIPASIGIGGKFSGEVTAIPHVGFKLADSFRYQENGYGIILYQNDGYRGTCAADKPFINQSKYLNLLQMEYFWFMRGKPVAPTEKIKMTKLKSGMFYDFLMFNEAIEHTFGIFIRPQIVFNDISIMNLEIYMGYDTSAETSIIGFTFTQWW